MPHLEQILLARGAYIAAVGVLETGLTETAIRLSRYDEYHSLRAHFPTRRNHRQRFLLDACSTTGKLGDWAPLLACFVRRLEAYSPLRDTLAHGAQTAISGHSASETQVRFKDYFAAAGGAQFRVEPVPLPILELKALKACRTARVWSRLYPRLDERIAPLD